MKGCGQSVILPFIDQAITTNLPLRISIELPLTVVLKRIYVLVDARAGGTGSGKALFGFGIMEGEATPDRFDCLEWISAMSTQNQLFTSLGSNAIYTRGGFFDDQKMWQYAFEYDCYRKLYKDDILTLEFTAEGMYGESPNFKIAVYLEVEPCCIHRHVGRVTSNWRTTYPYTVALSTDDAKRALIHAPFAGKLVNVEAFAYQQTEGAVKCVFAHSQDLDQTSFTEDFEARLHPEKLFLVGESYADGARVLRNYKGGWYFDQNEFLRFETIGEVDVLLFGDFAPKHGSRYVDTWSWTPDTSGDSKTVAWTAYMTRLEGTLIVSAGAALSGEVRIMGPFKSPDVQVDGVTDYLVGSGPLAPITAFGEETAHVLVTIPVVQASGTVMRYPFLKTPLEFWKQGDVLLIDAEEDISAYADLTVQLEGIISNQGRRAVTKSYTESENIIDMSVVLA